MTFLWPVMLLSLLLIPAGIALYLLLGRSRRRRARAFGMVRAGQARRTDKVRRVIPVALLTAGFVTLAVALARPQSVVGLPRFEGTVMLAFDVSGSMRATDFEPTRMDAAKEAARTFVDRQPDGIVIGVVAFSDSGFAVQEPTRDREEILAAIDRLAPERGTSLGQGILSSLTAIELAELGPDTNYYSNRSPEPRPEPTPVPPGTWSHAAVVLLTDGENNENPDPLEVADLAAERGVRIHTVGIGSPEGSVLELDGFRVHSRLNEPLLRQIADTTGGNYYAAADNRQLEQIYAGLDTRLVVRPEAIEVTSILIGAGVAMLVAGAAVSLLAQGRWP
jgi:Ca-activated chloride channel family protein